MRFLAALARQAPALPVGCGAPGASWCLSLLASLSMLITQCMPGSAAQVLDMPSQDLGAPAHRKFDIEAWMPGLGR